MVWCNYLIGSTFKDSLKCQRSLQRKYKSVRCWVLPDNDSVTGHHWVRHVQTVGSSSHLSLSLTEITGAHCSQGLNTLMVRLPLPPHTTEVSVTPPVSLSHFSLQTQLETFQLYQVVGVNILPPHHWPVGLTAAQVTPGRALLEDLHFTAGLSEPGCDEDRHAGSPPHDRAVTTRLGLSLSLSRSVQETPKLLLSSSVSSHYYSLHHLGEAATELYITHLYTHLYTFIYTTIISVKPARNKNNVSTYKIQQVFSDVLLILTLEDWWWLIFVH